MSDNIRILLIIVAMGCIGMLRYYYPSSPAEPQIEKAIEQVVELETGIDIFAAPIPLENSSS